MTKKIGEHIVLLLITVLLTYGLSFIPFLNDTHKHVKYDLLIERNLNLVPNKTIIRYKIFNDGALVLNSSNTIIEYNSSHNPIAAFFITPKGQEENITPKTKTSEKIRLSIPKWLQNRETFDLVIAYQGFVKIEDQLKIKYSKDSKYSTISASSNAPGFSSKKLSQRLIIYTWITYILVFGLILISVYWIKSLIQVAVANYNKRLEEKFISKENQFLTDEERN